MQKAERDCLHNPLNRPPHAAYFTIEAGVKVEEKTSLRKTYGRQHRVKSHAAFQQVYENGTSYVDRCGVFYVMASTTGSSQLGTAVGKRLGHAVLRNSIKRKMREVFRQHQHTFHHPVCLVWVARRPIIHAPYAVYEKVFYRLAKKAGLL